MKLKICGLTTLHDVECVNKAQVDFAGFVFTPHRQQITLETARMLKKALNPGIKTVGVFVEENLGFINPIIEEGVIDWVQFHGNTEYKLFCPAIRAFRMKSKSDIIPTDCNYVLFDSYTEGHKGATGETFDWKLIEYYDRSKPFFIAGGINVSNIHKVMTLDPYCIDISSGAEEYGKKSLQKIIEISKCIKTYCQN